MSDTTMRPSENLRAQLRGLSIKAHELLDLIVAEFISDPMSVQCFDRRIVERAKLCVATRKELIRKGVIFGPAEEPRA